MDCINENKYIISLNNNRRENIQFINEYRLDSNKQRNVLMGIEVEDFCHSLQNTNRGFEHEVLYVFCPQKLLFDVLGNEELVDIYIKFNIIEGNRGQRVVTISFHKRNKPITYVFR